MILTDTGPLVALSDEDDSHHRAAIGAVSQLPRQRMLTTMPCLTEAMYLLHRLGGFPAQEALWQLIDSGWLVLHQTTEDELQSMAGLMAKYHDLPMDLADASLIAAAESLNTQRIFTLDQDFRVYRFADGFFRGGDSMTQRTRAFRRGQSQRAKARAIRYLQRVFGDSREQLTPQKIAEFAEVRTPCSCWMCGNPRRFTGEATRQELKAVCDRSGD